MVDITDIRTFPFPTLADPALQDVITAVQILRGETDRRGRQTNPFTEADRERFQQEALSGGRGRLDRVLATLDAIIQQNPAAALGTALPGPVGGLAGIAGLVEGRIQGRRAGDILRELAGSVTREGRAIAERRAGSPLTAVEREIRDRLDREDRERAVSRGGPGASPRRGDVSNAGR
ncbi:MAG: hypothetical protein ACR2OV_15855 [Hyphomicrobiaceae bacterium]